MLLRSDTTGSFEVYDISNNKITFATSMGSVGLDWQIGGQDGFGNTSSIGNFSSKGEADMILRNGKTGALELYDINSNQITNAFALGTVGTDWFIVGTGNFSSNPGESDLLMRQANTGKFEVYDIANNQITAAASMGSVGLDWQPGGVAADPPASAANSTAQLVQAMAGFGGGGATESLNTAPLTAETSQQPLLTTPQHA